MIPYDPVVSAPDEELENQIVELQRLNHDLQRMMDTTGIGILFFDQHLNLRQYTPGLAEHLSLTLEQTEQSAPCKPHTLCHDCLYQDALKVFTTVKPLEREIRTRSDHWYLVRMRPYCMETCPEGVVISFFDITNQKRTQHELQERTKELRCLYTVSELFAQTDASLESLLQQTTTAILPSWQYPDITCARIIFQEQVFTTDNFCITPWRLSADILMRDEPAGSIDVFYLEPPPLLDTEPFLQEEHHLLNTLARQIGTLAERKCAAEMIVHEKNLTQQYLDVAGALFVVLDTSGCVTLINKKGCDLLGYEAKEIIGKNWFDHFLPNRIKNNVNDAFHHLMRGDITHVSTFENEILTRSGKERFILWNNTVIRDDDGTITATLGSGTDITQQRALEREVIHISEKEQRRFGQELHDGLGSHLSGLAMLSRGLAQTLKAGGTILPEDLEVLAELANKGVTQARALARGLNPVWLDTLGLSEALRKLAAETQARTTIACSFVDDAVPFALSDETVIQLYRIAQEGLSNAVRHARATQVHLRLHTRHDELVLTIHDDGQGFATTPRHHDGMGLHIMPYRARIIGATFNICSGTHGGTVITCCLPLNNGSLHASL